MENTKVRLTGLYKKQSRNGVTFYAGKLGAATMLLFQNGRKSSDTDPDVIAYLVPTEDRQRQQDRQERPRQSAPEPPPLDDDIPF